MALKLGLSGVFSGGSNAEDEVFFFFFKKNPISNNHILKINFLLSKFNTLDEEMTFLNSDLV
jgi:hypothetical protein